MSKKKNKQLLSDCCRAEIRTSDFIPDFIEDNPKTMTIGTCYFICSKCGEACNIYVPIRRTWKINPKTQILQNKKKKSSTKLTPKELKEIHKREDF
jgi:hypothetical protein